MLPNPLRFTFSQSKNASYSFPVVAREVFRVPAKIHQTTMDANTYTISQGISKWSAKIEITGGQRGQQLALLFL